MYIVPFCSLITAKAEISNKCKQKKNTKKSSMKKKTDKKKKTIPFHGQRLCKPRYFRRIYCESTIPDYVIPGGSRIFQPRTFQPQGLTPNFSTLDFSTKNSSTGADKFLWASGFKSSWLKSSWLNKFIAENFPVGKCGVSLGFSVK